METIQELKTKYDHIKIQDVLDYIDAVCDMDYDEANRMFEENKSQFAPIMIKRWLIRKNPEYKELYDRYQQTYIKEAIRRKPVIEDDKPTPKKEEKKAHKHKPFM